MMDLMKKTVFEKKKNVFWLDKNKIIKVLSNQWNNLSINEIGL